MRTDKKIRAKFKIKMLTLKLFHYIYRIFMINAYYKLHPH